MFNRALQFNKIIKKGAEAKAKAAGGRSEYTHPNAYTPLNRGSRRPQRVHKPPMAYTRDPNMFLEHLQEAV